MSSGGAEPPAATRQPQPFRFKWEQQIRDDPAVTKHALAVLLVMATHSNMDGSSITVGVEKLSAECGLSPPAIKRATSLGRRLGYIEQLRRGSKFGEDGYGRPSEHALRLPELGPVVSPE